MKLSSFSKYRVYLKKNLTFAMVIMYTVHSIMSLKRLVKNNAYKILYYMCDSAQKCIQNAQNILRERTSETCRYAKGSGCTFHFLKLVRVPQLNRVAAMLHVTQVPLPKSGQIKPKLPKPVHTKIWCVFSLE